MVHELEHKLCGRNFPGVLASYLDDCNTLSSKIRNLLGSCKLLSRLSKILSSKIVFGEGACIKHKPLKINLVVTSYVSCQQKLVIQGNEMNNQIKPTIKAQPESYLAIELKAYEEMLWQSHQTFKVYIAGIIIALVFSIVGLSLAFTGKATEGTITGVTGIGTVTYFTKLANESNQESTKKLEKLMQEIKVRNQLPHQ